MCIHPQPFNESDEDAMPSLAVTAIPTPKSNAVPLRLWIGLAMSGKNSPFQSGSVLRVVAGRLALWQIEDRRADHEVSSGEFFGVCPSELFSRH